MIILPDMQWQCQHEINLLKLQLSLYLNTSIVTTVFLWLHSNQGKKFESKVIKEFCKLAGVAKSCTTPYHSMGNGLVERFNHTLIKMFGYLGEL